MTRRALVIPPADTDPIRLVAWREDSELLPLLEREILGASPADGYLDCSPQIRTEHGTVCMWVGDESLLDGSPPNARALGLCHACGYLTPGVAGTAVFTGGADEEGETLTFPDEMLAIISAALDPGFMAAYDALTAAGVAVTIDATATHPKGS